MKDQPVQLADGDIGTVPAIAFVGVLATAEAETQEAAFNRAGQMFVEGLLGGLAEAGLPADILLGVEPISAFPRGERLFGKVGSFRTPAGRPVRLLPFINVQPLKWLTSGLSVFAALVAWAWRNRGRTRLVHCLNLSMPPGLFVWLGTRLTWTKALVSVNDVVTPGGVVPTSLFRKVDLVLHRWLLPRFDGWMVVSHAIANDFLAGRPVCLVEGGVSPGAFSASLRAENAASARPFRMVLAGSLEFFNGVSLALDAMKFLPDGFELLIAGKGTLDADIRSAAARDTRIVHRGFLEFSDVLELYRSADLLLNVRVTRAIDTRYFFPSKLMELLASGTPVLSTCTGHVEEEYGPYLYLLRDETAEQLAARILDIAATPPDQRRLLGAAARKFMLAEKTWGKQGEKLARYIRSEVLK